MVKTRSQRAVEVRALNDLRLAFKIYEIRESIFGHQGYDVVLLETRANYEGKTGVERGEEMNCMYWSESMRTCWQSVEDRKKFVLMMAREEIINEDRDILSGLLKACGVVGHTGFVRPASCKVDPFLQISMTSTSSCVKADEVDLVGYLSPVIRVGDEEDTVAELVEWPRLKCSRVEYPTGSSHVSQGGDYLYLLPDLAKEKKSRHLGDEVSLEYVQGVVKDSRTDGFCCYLAQFNYGLTLPLNNLSKSVMNMIGACPTQLNCYFWEVILVCDALKERWAASGSERRITAKDFLEYYAVKYVTATDGAYLSSSSSRPCFFDLSSAGRVWKDNLLWVSGECLKRSDEEPMELNNRTLTKGISCKVSRKESFIDPVAKEGTELEAVLKELEISRFKRGPSKDDMDRRSQAKRRMIGKTPGSMKEKLLTPELNTPLKLARLNEMPDGPVEMATISSTVVKSLAKRKAVKWGAASHFVTSDSVDDNSKRRKVTSPTKSQVVLKESDKIAEGLDLRLRFVVEAGLLEEQCRAKAREKMVVVVDDEFNKLELEKEREAVALKLKEVRAESIAEAERLVTASATSRNNLAGKLYQLRYTKAKILVFNEGNYEVKEIVDEEEVEEMEDGLNIAEKTTADNQETIDQEIASSHLRVIDSEGLLEVEKKSSAELQKELDIAREREEHTLLYNAEYTNEYEALISQYEDLLDDNVKLSIKLKEAKRQFEDKTATILSRDLALNQLPSELAELKEKVASGSRHEAELAEYRIRVLNDEISDMKCNIRALNEHLLKREIDMDTARTNLAVFEADFEKLSSSIMGKDLELRNSAQICDSLIARLDRLKVDLRRLKGKEAQYKADLAEVQAKNKSLVDELAHARRNVRRIVQRDKEMNERINQLCAQISEFERELRVREMKYQKDLKFELDKRDSEISFGEGSRVMKEFLRRKEELVENMRIDLTNSRQKSIDLTRQMSEHIDQLTAELAKSKARRLKDNKRAVVTHQSFKELVVHEQEKCDGEALHQWQLSVLVAFYVEEIKFLQVERDLMQDCFSGRTCVCKLDIPSIDPIGVMDRGIGTTTAEQIARGKKNCY
ncbi:hypothetical protein GIB67_004783 [Kingdonia uniflora]|uniref:Uncharacterized protein n=1 Tax=Kingdonia uniflora TaxID=39325 RepID=A0A7J7LNJ5_9MAGN|nr:hypothetical protein GIB67_004783 [Kingdonia uniflora]